MSFFHRILTGRKDALLSSGPDTAHGSRYHWPNFVDARMDLTKTKRKNFKKKGNLVLRIRENHYRVKV